MRGDALTVQRVAREVECVYDEMQEGENRMSVLPPNDTLKEIIATGRVYDAGGKEHDLHSALSAEHAVALYRAVFKEAPKENR